MFDIKNSAFRIFIFVFFLIFLFSLSVFSSERKVIHNPDKGLWEHDPSKQIILTYLYTLDGTEAGSGEEFYNPRNVAVNDSGEIFILDSGNNRIQKFDKDGHFLMSIGRKGKGPGEFLEPYDITIDKKGNIYVADFSNGRLQVFSANGNLLYGIKLPANPSNVEVDNLGYIYIQMGSLFGIGRNLLYKYDQKGNLITSFVKAIMDRDAFIASAWNHLETFIDNDNYIYIARKFTNKIIKYDIKGDLLLEFDRKLPYKSQSPKVTQVGNSVGIKTPPTILSITCDKQGLIYVLLAGKDADYMKENGNLIIDIFNNKGEYLYKISTGRSLIAKIYIDSQRNLYLIDSWNAMKVYKYSLKMK